MTRMSSFRWSGRGRPDHNNSTEDDENGRNHKDTTTTTTSDKRGNGESQGTGSLSFSNHSGGNLSGGVGAGAGAAGDGGVASCGDASLEFSFGGGGDGSASFRTGGSGSTSTTLTAANKRTSSRSSSAGIAFQPQGRKPRNSLDDFSINKLDFQSLGLFGRQEELSQLSSCLQTIQKKQPNRRTRQMVLVSGYSGTGKTVLLSEAFEKPIMKQRQLQRQKKKKKNHHQGKSIETTTSDENGVNGGDGGVVGDENGGSDPDVGAPIGKERLQQSQETNGKNQRKSTVTTTTNVNDVGVVGGCDGTGDDNCVGVDDDIGGLYVRGKFEQYSDKPYSGLIMACCEMCGYIFSLQQTTRSNVVKEIRTRIVTELKNELPILIQMIPVLPEILLVDRTNDNEAATSADAEEEDDEEDDNQTVSTAMSAMAKKKLTQQQDATESKYRFQFALQRFLRIVGSYFHPLVLVLDDLQWADSSTLELVEVLIKDPVNVNLFVAGCYRSNEVTSEHILNRTIDTIRTIQEQKSIYNLDVLELEIGNLDLLSIQGMLMELISSGGRSTTPGGGGNGNTAGSVVATSAETTSSPFSKEDDPEMIRIHGLAKLCYKKTLGNPFFLIRYLNLLTERKLLQYNFGLMKWIWNENDIVNQTVSTENVVDLLMYEMKQLSTKQILILQIMACLGSTFPIKLFQLIWNELGIIHSTVEETGSSSLSAKKDDVDVGMASTTTVEEATVDDNKKLLEAAKELDFFVKEGYVRAAEYSNESSENGKLNLNQSYRWVHDKIQEAAICLLPESERSSFQVRVGEVLQSKLDEDDLQEALFVVANLLNSGSAAADGLVREQQQGEESATTAATEKRKKELINLARLNYTASCKARSISAFEGAAHYAGKGLANLGSNHWEIDHRLALNLLSAAAEAEGLVGNYAKREEYCDEVMKRRDCPNSDKFQVYHAWLDHLLSSCSFKEAEIFGLSVLAQFDCHFPKYLPSILVGIISNLVKVKKRKEKYLSMEALDNELNDPVRMELMRFLDRMTIVLYGSQTPILPLAVFRLLNWSMKYGWCEESPAAFATTAVILSAVLHEYQLGNEYGRHALKMIEVTGARKAESKTRQCVYALVLHRTTLARECTKGLLQGYEAGMKSGDTESAMWSIHNWLTFKYQAGESLTSWRNDLRVYTSQMQDLGREKAYYTTNVAVQSCHKLMGQDEDLLSLDGAIDEAVYKADEEFYEKAYSYWLGVLNTLYGQHKRNVELTLKWGVDHVNKGNPGTIGVYINAFMKGVSCMAVARQSKKRKHRKLASQYRKDINTWIKKGNPNVRHYGELLDAEWAALNGQNETATKHYQEAIILSARGGYLHDAGLSSERLGDFALHVLKDDNEATYRIKEAIRYYKDWGACGVVRRLEEDYMKLLPDLLPKPTQIVTNQEDSLMMNTRFTSTSFGSEDFSKSLCAK